MTRIKNALDDYVSFDPEDPSGHFTATVRSPKGRRVTVIGTLGDPEPEITGDAMLTDNAAIAQNLWSAVSEYAQAIALEEDDERTYGDLSDMEVRDRDDDRSRAESIRQKAADLLAEAEEEERARKEREKIRESHLDAAKELISTAETIAELTENLTDESTEGWCSNCVTETTHHEVASSGIGRDTHICSNCGVPTVHCSAIGCSSMAVKENGTKGLVPYCAEHRHDIASFTRANDTIPDIAEWRELVRYEKPDLAKRTTRLAFGTAALGVAASGAWLAAPAVGGFVGAQFLGYTGAVATNAGLAALGGGAVAAGGLGMAGGTYVVAAAGGVLGGVYGDRIVSSYVSEDDSFDIEKIRDGAGVPVVIARGFLNEGNNEWGHAVGATEALYPDSPVYLLSWGSKELKHLGSMVSTQFGAQAAKNALFRGVARASKQAAKAIAPVAPALAAGTLLKNPWHTAVNRANLTGTALAALLAKSDQEEFVLVGHSLGGRVMATAAMSLAGFGDQTKIRDIHLVGAAIGANRDWTPLNAAVSGTVHNYWSSNDGVLKYLYTYAQLGQKAIGYQGIHSSLPRIIDHDVSKQVKNHGRYYRDTTLQA